MIHDFGIFYSIDVDIVGVFDDDYVNAEVDFAQCS